MSSCRAACCAEIFERQQLVFPSGMAVYELVGADLCSWRFGIGKQKKRCGHFVCGWCQRFDRFSLLATAVWPLMCCSGVAAQCCMSGQSISVAIA